GNRTNAFLFGSDRKVFTPSLGLLDAFLMSNNASDSEAPARDPRLLSLADRLSELERTAASVQQCQGSVPAFKAGTESDQYSTTSSAKQKEAIARDSSNAVGRPAVSESATPAALNHQTSEAKVFLQQEPESNKELFQDRYTVLESAHRLVDQISSTANLPRSDRFDRAGLDVEPLAEFQPELCYMLTMGELISTPQKQSGILVSLNYHTWDGLSPSGSAESQIHGVIFTCYQFDKHLSSLLLRPPSLPELKLKPADLIHLDQHIPLSAIMKAVVELAQIQDVTLSLALKPGSSNDTDQRNTIDELVQTMFRVPESPLTPFFVLFCNVVQTSDPEDYSLMSANTEALLRFVDTHPPTAKLYKLFSTFLHLCSALIRNHHPTCSPQPLFSTSSPAMPTGILSTTQPDQVGIGAEIHPQHDISVAPTFDQIQGGGPEGPNLENLATGGAWNNDMSRDLFYSQPWLGWMESNI
ncbi:uncharacterized protein N7477_006606, partial [Penicillium maclennaniae]|uniref:uncharacterized protein n=1 Tax=Penicillium maclennaniae TaxID=1343394 RepID=UPI00254240BC